MPRRFANVTVIPGEEAPVKELVEVYVADITGPQASQLVKSLGQIAPLGSLDHLKRVRKCVTGSTAQLQIILYPAAAAAATAATAAPTAATAHTGDDLKPTEQPDAASHPESHQTAQSHPVAKQHTVSHPESQTTQNHLVGKQQQQQLAGLPDAVLQLVQKHGLHVHVVQVPTNAPATREQWKDWNTIWPISWRKPELTAVTAATAAAQALTAQEEAQMHTWMDRACDLAAASQSSGGLCNAALIVDPQTGTVIAEGEDQTFHHPLGHAIMVAIEAAAARDLHMWPVKCMDTVPDNPVIPRKDTVPEAVIQCKDAAPEQAVIQPNKDVTSKTTAATDRTAQYAPGVSPGDSPPSIEGIPSNEALAATAAASLSRRVLDAQHDAHDALQPAEDRAEKRQRINNAEVPADSSTSHISHERHAAAAPMQPKEKDSSTDPVNKSYLCTNFDCFVVQEPCAMCAMAATHARLRRVCYSTADGQQGALGGAFKLHGQSSLNHHYQVFHLPELT